MEGQHMKTATISAIPVGETPGYAWTWRSNTDNATGASAFAYYFDCVTDARNHGYDVNLAAARGAMTSDRARYALFGAGE
jgi:hypothetical protein